MPFTKNSITDWFCLGLSQYLYLATIYGEGVCLYMFSDEEKKLTDLELFTQLG